MPGAEKGLVNYEKLLLMKCTKSIDDMGAPCVTPWIHDSSIHYTEYLVQGDWRWGHCGRGDKYRRMNGDPIIHMMRHGKLNQTHKGE